jgi:hypothetical protein
MIGSYQTPIAHDQALALELSDPTEELFDRCFNRVAIFPANEEPVADL